MEKKWQIFRNFFVSKLCENGIILESYRQPPLNFFNLFKANNPFLYFRKNFKNFMVPFYGWGSTVIKATVPLRGDSVLCTIQFSGVPGTQLIDLGRMKG